MARYQVILTYDGAAFNGMQRQSNARTVQGEVEDALRKIGWAGQSITAAGRTDTGVHASGQVIGFDFDWGHSPEDLQNALNATLSQDVAVRKAFITRDDFHPRYDAEARIYRYSVFCKDCRDPLRERFAWRVWPALDLEKLKACAQQLVGEHDFAAFGTPPTDGRTTVRKIFAASWQAESDSFVFEVSANAFLYHMVRRMVNIQVDVGQGKREPNVISEYLAQKRDEMIQGLAPPNGLCLTEVRYPNDGAKR